MANKLLDMRKSKQLYRMWCEGMSRRRISRDLGISRNTVNKYIALFQKSRLTLEEVADLSEDAFHFLLGETNKEDTRHPQLFAYFPEVSKELKRVGVTRYILWEKYRDLHPDCLSYSRFCHLYKLWSRTQSPVMRFQHKAGDKMFVDYTGKKLSIVDQKTGEIREVEVFISVLGASGLTYVQACASQKREDFVQCMVGALEFYGGVPAAIVTDNLKAAVVKSSKYEPVINESLLAFSHHYGTTILPTRAYKPRDKALVENAVKIIYSRVFAKLHDQVFHSLHALNKAIAALVLLHNQTPLQGKGYSRLQLFESIEKQALAPLPVQAYQVRHYAMGTVYKSSHIHLSKDKHYYSVPFEYIGKKVRIIYTQDAVEIYWGQKRIALHQRNRKRYDYTTDPLHMPTTHRYVAEWNPDKFLNWAASIGVHCKTFIALLLAKKQHPEQSYKSCAGVLSLSKRVGNSRLDNACRRAMSYERISYKSVKSILEKGWDTIEEDTHEESTLPEHENIRGKDYYQ